MVAADSGLSGADGVYYASVNNEATHRLSTTRLILLSSPKIYTMTIIHRNPPFRAEHLGSLLRPAELLTKRTAFEKIKLSLEELARIENESISRVVELQKECGFRAISDGEYRLIFLFRSMAINGACANVNSIADAQCSGVHSSKSSMV